MDKRIVLCIVALVASVCVAKSQDTIKYGDSVYMYTNTTVPNYFCNGVFLVADSPLTLGTPIARRYYADSGMMVYGVAIAIANEYSNSNSHVIYKYADSVAYTDSIDEFVNRNRNPDCFSALLFKQMEDSVFLVDSVKWEYPSMERIVEYSVANQRTDCPPYGYVDTLRSYVHMFEFYFKTPHRVQGTFYVGEHNKSESYALGDYSCSRTVMDGVTHNITFYNQVIPEEYGKVDWIYFPDWNNDPNNYVVGITDYAAQYGFVYSFPELSDIGIFSFIHPILQPRYDICRAPGKPWMTARTGTSATFEWGEVEDSAMLVVGDYLGDPDTMAAIALGPGSTGHTVAGLEPGTYYGAWLRQRCRWQMQDGDSTRWSDWSELVIFSTDLEGIAAANILDFNVYPNPARGSFTVETEDLPARLTLYNAQGTEIYAVNLRSQRTTIGIADLPKGVYFAVLTTPTGSATRRLVNEGAF